jgi:5,6-dimethylbenzimidazole synthase
MMSTPDHRFSDPERRGLYRAIRERRDVRSQFLPDPIPPEVLVRLLQAAHHAPSVGFMQPWDFIVIDSLEVRQAVKAIFKQENQKAAENYAGEQAVRYRRLKLEGILESPINLCITCDRSRGGPHVLGRNTILETDLFSVCLAVQNLWLAARAEGLGVGWVSILDQGQLAETLKLPAEVYPVAYLCLGYVSSFLPYPELEVKGWRSRLPLHALVHANAWGRPLQNSPLEAALLGKEMRW